MASHPSLCSLRSPRTYGSGLGVAHGTRSAGIALLPPCSTAELRAARASSTCGGSAAASQELSQGLGLRGAEGLGRGERGHPSPCPADKPGPGWEEGSTPGPARSRQRSRRLGGPGLARPLHLGPVAPPLPAPPRPHGSSLSGPLLGHLPLTAGSLRLGEGATETRTHRLWQETSIDGAVPSRGRGLSQPAPLPAAVGFGVIPPPQVM